MKSKVTICALIFIGLTAAKLLYPDHAQTLRLAAAGVLTRNEDYSQTVVAMGRELTGEGAGWELIAALREGFFMNESNAKPTEMEPDGSEGGLPTVFAPDLGNDRTEAENFKEVPEVVSAFLEAQAAFDGYALPDNVRADMPQLPFNYVNPVDGYESSGFGYRLHPIDNFVKFHYGTDFAANSGETVRAFADGTVSAAGTSDGYGNYLILRHEENYVTLYAHLSAFQIQEGETVRCGQTIGLVGQTGHATGPHLHFELLQDEVYINPEYYV